MVCFACTSLITAERCEVKLLYTMSKTYSMVDANNVGRFMENHLKDYGLELWTIGLRVSDLDMFTLQGDVTTE